MINIKEETVRLLFYLAAVGVISIIGGVLYLFYWLVTL